jgi:hypothetical protein
MQGTWIDTKDLAVRVEEIWVIHMSEWISIFDNHNSQFSYLHLSE